MRRLVVLPFLLAAVVLGGCATQVTAGGPDPASVGAPPVTSATELSLPKSVPVSLEIPKINARSNLLSLGLAADGSVALPPVTTPMQASWFNGSPTPGQFGPSVIFGHVDGDKQAGIFFRLHELARGDLVLVKRTDGTTATFQVTKIEEISKSTFPTDEVYGNTSDAELRLITCGGSFDSSVHSYRDNIIVFAALHSTT
ncbi:MAG TPA: class F sortase [Pseudonocardiaceae bacterium]|jgi:LPXTG-site transpeptidase (sortase) family protein